MKNFMERLGILKNLEEQNAGRRFDIGENIDDNLDFREEVEEQSFLQRIFSWF